ncbi:metal-dependent hydrolase [Haloferax larsenii]|uniref:LexA-binding, inner membrane-associated putative hydrolase n=1 Tax=Haloferax larsenii TaxID=302484 RepID=A0A1H7TDN9_HALLR|nr:metal-dependent hydrolase [Haloferax larsenii]SEL82941.1 LexA-binding, inner membrane-associated putative hydrolase [Haloferax larsenii]
MFPFGHLAFGYLSYVFTRLARRQPLPQGWLVGCVVLGTQLPDLVDKPLTYVGVLPSGRTLGHSLFFAVPLLVGVGWWAHNAGDDEHAIAWGVGLVSHYVGDVYALALAGDWWTMRFLLWPVFPTVLYPDADAIPPWVRVVNSLGDPRFRVQNALFALAGVLWIASVIRRRWRGEGHK